MKLPSFKRLFDRDFPAEFKQLISQLGLTVNSGFDSIYNALNNNLTFADNFNGTISTFDVAVNASGIPVKVPSFTLSTNQTNVTGLLLLNVNSKGTTTVYPTSGVTITFTKESNKIYIQHITGLTVGTTYTISVIVV